MVGLLNGQQVYLDGNFEDWSNVDYLIDDANDKTGLEIRSMGIVDDDRYLYFFVELNSEINLQQNNTLSLLIDLDNNASTGQQSNGLGIEFIYDFGERRGLLNGRQVFHDDIDFFSIPTVSSDRFELAISKDKIYESSSAPSAIKAMFRLGQSNSDFAPNPNTISEFTFSNTNFTRPFYSLEKDLNTDLRILSYNVLRDNIFNFARETNFRNILNAIQADLMCFQEIYDFDENQLLLKLELIGLIDESENWFAVKDGRDLITVSKYPIIDHTEVAGNSFVQIQTPEGVLSVFNCHLPCCDNDAERRDEIDQLLVFLREALVAENNYDIPPFSPYIFLGDMNLVGSADQLMSLTNGDITANFIYGDDVVMDYGNGDLAIAKTANTLFPGLFTWYNPESTFPPGQLDFIIYTDSQLDIKNVFALNTEGLTQNQLNEFGLNIGDTRLASDHSPLVMDFSFSASSSVQPIADLNFTVIPNPASGSVVLNLEREADRAEIIDVYGRPILSKTNIQSGETLDISMLTAGSYIVKIYEGKKNGLFKLIVQ